MSTCCSDILCPVRPRRPSALVERRVPHNDAIVWVETSHFFIPQYLSQFWPRHFRQNCFEPQRFIESHVPWRRPKRRECNLCVANSSSPFEDCTYQPSSYAPPTVLGHYIDFFKMRTALI